MTKPIDQMGEAEFQAWVERAFARHKGRPRTGSYVATIGPVELERNAQCLAQKWRSHIEPRNHTAAYLLARGDFIVVRARAIEIMIEKCI